MLEISVGYKNLGKRSVLSKIVPHGRELDMNEVLQGKNSLSLAVVTHVYLQSADFGTFLMTSIFNLIKISSG